MIVASIDIGTNTILLLIASVGPGGILTPLYHEQQIPRLGRNVDASGALSTDAMSAAADVIQRYADLARGRNADRITACATSAVRDAVNRDEFLSIVRGRTGIAVEILNGTDEAAWTYAGAVGGLSLRESAPVVIDIGGGSTEVTSASGPRSYQAGAVRITERWFHHDPPLDSEITAAEKDIREIFGPLSEQGDAALIGVAGTCTSLACIDLGLSSYNSVAVHGHRLSAETVAEMSGRLLKLTVREIRELSEVTAGRADILAAGSLILRTYISLTGSPGIIVSDRGLRYGLVIREAKRIGSGLPGS